MYLVNWRERTITIIRHDAQRTWQFGERNIMAVRQVMFSLVCKGYAPKATDAGWLYTRGGL